MQGDSEEFLSLEDEEIPPVKKSKKSPKNKGKSVVKSTSNVPVTSSPVQAEIIDMEVIGDYGGTHNLCWPIHDMDCPDCASKAMNALNRLSQVNSSKVSATDGTVTLEIDFEKGNVSEASAILSSLGNDADLPYLMVSGVQSSSVATRHNIAIKSLPRVFRRQPGILDCEIDRDNNILLQIAPDMPAELENAMNHSLKAVLGSNFELISAKNSRLSGGQWRMIGSGISFMMLLLLIIVEQVTNNRLVFATIGIIGVLAGGTKMFKQAYASIQNRQLGFQVLTSLAVIGASFLGAWYEALMVIILVSWTEHMESEALIKARNAMQGGLDRLPKTARRIPKKTISSIGKINAPVSMSPAMVSHNGIEEVPIGLVVKGDHVEIRSGELIPVDGTVISGQGSVNKAPLTGESVPVDVSKGDELQAGLTLSRGPVTVEVNAVGEDTRLSGLIEKVHTFKEQPTRLQGILENFTALWVPIVLIGAVIAWLVQPDEDWKLILLLWVVACPCALLLATPVPHAASLSLASKKGAIARGGDVMEALAKVNLALLDKTGTLTSGKPKIGNITLSKGRRRESAIALAAGIEASSNHPYAEAISDFAVSEKITPIKVSNISDGEDGVYGKVTGVEVSFVKADSSKLKGSLLNALNEALSEGYGASLLTKDNKPVALFTFIHDDLRDGTDELVMSLHKMGVNVEIISGDNQEAVNSLAKNIGLPVNNAHGEMTPEQKVNWVQSRSETHITMMVGDGFNDAAAMAAADVGIAIGTGESANLEAADVLIPGDDPRLISDLIKVSKKTRKILMTNITYSVAITLALVYMVLVGINTNLAVGVLIHELSVIGVIINGARLSGTGGTVKLIGEIGKSIWTGTIDSFKALNSLWTS